MRRVGAARTSARVARDDASGGKRIVAASPRRGAARRRAARAGDARTRAHSGEWARRGARSATPRATRARGSTTTATARTRRGRELELAFESATTGAAEAWGRGRDAGDDEDARERDARDAEDEYERIAARMEARMARAFEALEARARRARERESGSSSSDGERARANASEATTTTRRLEELEDRLRSATTTLRATHEELERERKRCAELDAALARARDSTTAAFGEKIQTTRELAEAVAALEGEKADAMHERARLLEVKHALELRTEEVRLEAKAVRDAKARIESENETTHSKMRELRRKLLESEAARMQLLERVHALERDGVVDGAVMNENLRDRARSARRAKRGALEEALTDLKLASDASMELSVALRQEVEALRSSGAQPSVSLSNIEPTDEIPPRAASAIEAHLIWRRRDARNEPGDASSDWVKAESIVTDRLARADGARVVYWAYLNALAELLRVGDVAAFDQTSWRALGDFVARVLAASRASSSS